MDSSFFPIFLTATAGAVVLVAGLVIGLQALKLGRPGSGPPSIRVKVPRQIPTRGNPAPLQSLADLLATFTQRRSLESAYEVVANKTVEALSASFAAVFIREDNDDFVVQATAGQDHDIRRTLRLGRDNPVVRYVEQGDKPVAHLVPGHTQLPLFRKLLPNVREIMAAALVADEEVFGFLLAANKREGGSFTPQDVETLSYLSIPVALHVHNAQLNNELEVTFSNTIIAMAKALEARDHFTRGHSERVAQYATEFASWLNFDAEAIATLRDAALLHDLGKIGIPDCVLLKPGKLDPGEYETMKKHPEIGYDILKDLKFLEAEAFMVRHHHEKYDGTGYPLGLAREQIPETVIVLSLADVFDAITSERPHRPARSFEDALAEMGHMSGSNFDPRFYKRFVEFIQATHIRSTTPSPYAARKVAS